MQSPIPALFVDTMAHGRNFKLALCQADAVSCARMFFPLNFWSHNFVCDCIFVVRLVEDYWGGSANSHEITLQLLDNSVKWREIRG